MYQAELDVKILIEKTQGLLQYPTVFLSIS